MITTNSKLIFLFIFRHTPHTAEPHGHHVAASAGNGALALRGSSSSSSSSLSLSECQHQPVHAGHGRDQDEEEPLKAAGEQELARQEVWNELNEKTKVKGKKKQLLVHFCWLCFKKQHITTHSQKQPRPAVVDENVCESPHKRLPSQNTTFNVSRFAAEFLDMGILGAGEFGTVHKCQHRLGEIKTAC